MRISDWSSTCALPICLGLNAQWGLAGHLNFGIAGFFAVGAFTTALFTTAVPTGVLAQYAQQAFGLELPFLVGVAAAAALAAVVGFLVSIPVLRLRLDFLAIATLGIAEIIRSEARRVGKEGVSPWSSRWSPYP